MLSSVNEFGETVAIFVTPTEMRQLRDSAIESGIECVSNETNFFIGNIPVFVSDYAEPITPRIEATDKTWWVIAVCFVLSMSLYSFVNHMMAALVAWSIITVSCLIRLIREERLTTLHNKVALPLIRSVYRVPFLLPLQMNREKGLDR